MIRIFRLLFWTLPILLWDGLRLIGLVICLFPGFVRFAWYYFVKANRKSVRFGRDSCRQTLDIYSLATAPGGPNNRGDEEVGNGATNLLGSPVVLFFTGGAWLIGYKMWGALLARALNAAGIVVVIPDMRNYPGAQVPSMVNDAEESLIWALENIACYGGDPRKIVIVGQSAGGHVACTALLQRAKALSENEERSDYGSGEGNGEEEPLARWRPIDFKGFVSLSAPYSLTAMEKTFTRHGLDEHLVDHIFGGDRDRFDPHRIVLNYQRNCFSFDDHLPPIRVYHGSLDKTVPHEGSEDFVRDLANAVLDSQQVTFASYEGWSHTDPILEGPMDADHRFHRDLFDAVKQWTDSSHLEWPENDPLIKEPLCPHWLVQAGRFCNPF